MAWDTSDLEVLRKTKTGKLTKLNGPGRRHDDVSFELGGTRVRKVVAPHVHWLCPESPVTTRNKSQSGLEY